jgi:hypothetical protein
MTVEIVSLGQPKPPPYANSTAEERLAAAVRLIAHHQALRGVLHGHVRATDQMDIFVRASKASSRRVVAALEAFGAPLQAHALHLH